VVGGVAVVLHGHVRPIADLDLVVDPAPEEMSRAVRTLNALGFVQSIPLPLSALTVMRMFDQHEREIDVFARYAIPFAELWEDSEHRRVGHGMARVASLEHVLRGKRINGRALDLPDIEGLLALEAGNRGRGEAADVAAGEQAEPE
jgi:hypothetical protein